MPLYEYRCTACGQVFEKIQSFNAPEQSECPKCGGTSERLLSAPAIQFKGSGFYLTDYGKAGSGKSPAGESRGEGKNESKPGGSGSPSSDSGSGVSSTTAATPASAPSSSSSGTNAASGATSPSQKSSSKNSSSKD